jgi:EAL domain-containing protein (putative c-di-GMP-specific phosphodiesterase class I)
VFQPVVRLADAQSLAYEALTRFADGSPPERRFADAHAVGLDVELETATLRAALDGARDLPEGVVLSVNVSPSFVLRNGTLTGLFGRARRPLVLELTEREPIEDHSAFRKAIAGLDVAVDWAVDDAGAGYASLRHIIELRPRYVKLDRVLSRASALIRSARPWWRVCSTSRARSGSRSSPRGSKPRPSD